MGMVNWFKGILSSVLPSPIVGQGAQEADKKEKPHLFDVADGYFLAEEARKLGVNFVRRSRSDFENLWSRMGVRRKVRKNIAEFYDLPDLVDEVTEKIVEYSREDSRFKKFLGS